VHDLTLAIDESGRACRRLRRRARPTAPGALTAHRARRAPPLSPAPVPAPQSAKLRDAACADVENGVEDTYVRSAKGEPARHAEDARHHR